MQTESITYIVASVQWLAKPKSHALTLTAQVIYVVMSSQRIDWISTNFLN